jgi:hypothetical protein
MFVGQTGSDHATAPQEGPLVSQLLPTDEAIDLVDEASQEPTQSKRWPKESSVWGKTAIIAGLYAAKTAGFIFGRTSLLAIESRWAKQMP